MILCLKTKQECTKAACRVGNSFCALEVCRMCKQEPCDCVRDEQDDEP